MKRTGRLLTALAACSMLLSATRMNGQGPTCASAVVIAAPGTYSADGPSSGAGATPLPCPNDDGTSANPGVNADWYQWTAPSSGVLIVGSITAGLDTRVSIHTGTCGSLVCAGGDDDLNFSVNTASWETNNLRSRVAIPVVSGTTYYIQWDNAWSSTAFQWNLAFSADPAVGTVVNSFPYAEEFDGLTTCTAGANTICASECPTLGGGWTNNTGDVGDVFLRAGATPTGSTGPDFGGTNGNVTTDKYLYLESSMPVIPMVAAPFCTQPYQVAVVTSPSYNTSAFVLEPQVRFSDHIFGSLDPTRAGTMLAQYEVVSGSGNWVTFFSKTGSQGNQWNTNPYTTLPLGTTSFRVRWIFIRGNFFQSDMAIDHVQVRERPDCSAPTATATVIDNCQPTAGASTFTVQVTATDFGSLAGVPETQFTVVPSSGASQVVTSGTPTATFGPYAFGTVVTFALTHNSEPACNSTIAGTYRSCCSSTCATAFTPSLGVNANANTAFTTCTGGATNAYDSDAPVPTAARWWAYTPAASGVYNISSCAQAPVTNTDTRVSVHTGACGGLTLYSADDDGCVAPVTFASTLDVYMQSGTTYYIEWDNAWESNAHTWSLTGPSAPILGDVCSDAIPLTMSATCSNTLVSSAGATAESPSCAAGVGASTNADVWMSFVATDDLCQIDITPVGVYYPVLELLDGTCGTPTSLCCTFSGAGAGTPLTLLRGGLTIGNTYLVRVGHAFGGGDGGTNQFNICVTEGVAPTPACTFPGTPDYVESEPCGTLTNSFLCDAEPIVLGSLPFTFTIGGTIQAECNFRDRDFFIFTLPSVGTYQVDFTAQFASRIFFLDANVTCAEPLTQINTAGALACATGTITQSLAPGTYALMMTTDGIFNNLTCGTLNDYEMTITAVPDLDCGLAVPIVCGDPYGVALSGPGLWSVTSCGFTTPGNESIYLLDATVAGTYNLSVTAANGQFVDYFFKPTSSGCTPAGWSCIGDIAAAGTSVEFNIVTPGQYWILADAEDDAVVSSQTFRVFCPTVTSGDYCAPIPLTCATSAQGQTNPIPGVFPPSACPYPVAPSTGGVNYWSYTAPADGEVTLSTCGAATFDTRISVYLLAPDCNNLECIAKNDDGTGCPNFSSEVAFPVVSGSTYLVAVHGFGGDFGFYSMSVFCAPPCTPTTGNDRCAQAEVLIPALDDGNGVATPGDNTCAYGDENTGCDPFGAMQGVWYGFNSGPNSIMMMDLVMGTATSMNYALYDGGCAGLGALNEITCVLDGDGAGTLLPSLTPSTNYLLYLWNNGGLSSEGDFSVLLRRPGMNDAAIDTILEPEGEFCNTGLVPRVVLRNAGEADLTSAVIVYDVDGGTPQNFNWSGNLAYQETDTIYLPTINTVPGVHTLSVTATQPNGSSDELPGNDEATKQVNVTGESANVMITTDNNGDQITWTITDAFGFNVASGGPYTGQNNQLISTTVCLPTTFGTCYSLYLLDSGGDGLCCLSGSGSWELRTTNNRLLLRDLFNSTPSGGISPPNSQPLGHEFCLPIGPSGILGTECNIFTNQLLNKVYTSTVPGTLNYQFEFTDPDAGYRRRISVARPWVQFSEMQTSPLVPGVVYFCRARADQGASGFTDDHFGAGCEMGLDVNNVPGCTQLIDNPSLPTHSCGVTKSFGGSAKIWAVPVVGATQYRFNFNNLGEGYNRNVLRTSYVCPLSWVTQPLVNGSTYNVTVEVFANGLWGGFCGAACTVTILNPPAQSQLGRSVIEEPTNGSISLYPNPVRDGRVQLLINGMTDEEQAIEVEIYDLYGKRVDARQYQNSGTVFNTVLELDGRIAAGVYLVNITMNGEMTTRLLSVM